MLHGVISSDIIYRSGLRWCRVLRQSRIFGAISIIQSLVGTFVEPGISLKTVSMHMHLSYNGVETYNVGPGNNLVIIRSPKPTKIREMHVSLLRLALDR